MADRWIKGEDGAQAYGCKITWIRHHSPELIVKDGWSEVERISLERMRSAQEIDILRSSRYIESADTRAANRLSTHEAAALQLLAACST